MRSPRTTKQCHPPQPGPRLTRTNSQRRQSVTRAERGIKKTERPSHRGTGTSNLCCDDLSVGTFHIKGHVSCQRMRNKTAKVIRSTSFYNHIKSHHAPCVRAGTSAFDRNVRAPIGFSPFVAHVYNPFRHIHPCTSLITGRMSVLESNRSMLPTGNDNTEGHVQCVFFFSYSVRSVS